MFGNKQLRYNEGPLYLFDNSETLRNISVSEGFPTYLWYKYETPDDINLTSSKTSSTLFTELCSFVVF